MLKKWRRKEEQAIKELNFKASQVLLYVLVGFLALILLYISRPPVSRQSSTANSTDQSSAESSDRKRNRESHVRHIEANRETSVQLLPK